jgi:CBS domain-containing protein
MTPVVKTLRRNDQLTLADDLMRAQRIRHLPVLDEDDLVCGVVSQRDLFRGALAKALGYGQTAQQKLHSLLLVKEVMSTSVVTIGPHEPIANAARAMLEHKIGCLPVVDGERLLGIVTESDFVALALDAR